MGTIIWNFIDTKVVAKTILRLYHTGKRKIYAGASSIFTQYQPYEFIN